MAIYHLHMKVIGRSSGASAVAAAAYRSASRLRGDPNARADRFVARWRRLDRRSGAQYRAGDDADLEASRKAMSEMARSLERDPRMGPLFTNRKSALGLDATCDSGRRLVREPAFHQRLELGRSRSRNLGL